MRMPTPSLSHRCTALMFGLPVLLVLFACAPVRALPAPAQTNDVSAETILQKADAVRFPAQSFELLVAVTTHGNSETPESHNYEVLSKGREDTVILVTAPASERGQILLMKGRDLWIFLPTVSQPVRLSMSQRLTGEVANGDLARTSFEGDYDPKLVRTDEVDGEPMYVLELTALEHSVAYHRVVLWVRKSNFWPAKAEFYSLSDRLLKSCTYGNYREMAGRMRPTRLTLQDSLHPDEESVMDYTAIRTLEIPDKYFTKDYLKHLQ